MTGVSTLVLAVDVARRRRDDAGLVVAQMLRRQESAQLQFEQLRSYATETETRWSVSAQSSVTPQIVSHYYQFIERLEQTIDLQQAVIADLDRQCRLARKVLIDAELRVAGLNRLLENRRSVLAAADARREQKSSDELAAQQLRRSATEREIRENQ